MNICDLTPYLRVSGKFFQPSIMAGNLVMSFGKSFVSIDIEDIENVTASSSLLTIITSEGCHTFYLGSCAYSFSIL